MDVTSRLAEALSGLQATAEAEALIADPRRDPSPWMFPSSADTPLDPSAVAKVFRSVLRASGLPRFRLYDLRHTFATHLLAQGAPITYVAAQLGHAKPTTTLTYYAHWLPSGDKRYIDRLEALRLASGSKVVAAPEERSTEVRDSEWSRRRDLNPRPADYEGLDGGFRELRRDGQLAESTRGRARIRVQRPRPLTTVDYSLRRRSRGY